VSRGAQVTALKGVLRFGSGSGSDYVGAFRLIPTSPPLFSAPTATSAVPAVAGRLRVAALNLFNYFQHPSDTGKCFPSQSAESCRGANTARELARQQAKLVTLITQLDADVLAVTEVENDGGGAAASTIERLADTLNAAGQTRCSRYLPVVVQGPLGGDAIAVGVLYCEDSLAVAPETEPAVLTDDWLTSAGVALAFPVFSGPSTSRSPLAVSLRERVSGETFTLVVNHLKSKGPSGLDAEGSVCWSRPELDADCDQADGQAYFNARRRAAVAALSAWLATAPTGSRDPDLLLVGDFNAYRLEQPLEDLRRAGYSDALESSYGYSYVFDGEAGALEVVLQTCGFAFMNRFTKFENLAHGGGGDDY